MAVFREFVALTAVERLPLLNKLDELLRGKVNTVAEVTLAANQTTTTVADELVSPNSHIALTPMTATAAAESPWISSQGSGTYTLSHANSGQSDRTYRVNVTG